MCRQPLVQQVTLAEGEHATVAISLDDLQEYPLETTFRVTGYGGEVGHIPVRPDGIACSCGALGCWETEVGEPALCRALGLPEDAPRGAVVAALRGLDDPSVLDELARRLGLDPVLLRERNIVRPGEPLAAPVKRAGPDWWSLRPVMFSLVMFWRAMPLLEQM